MHTWQCNAPFSAEAKKIIEDWFGLVEAVRVVKDLQCSRKIYLNLNGQARSVKPQEFGGGKICNLFRVMTYYINAEISLNTCRRSLK